MKMKNLVVLIILVLGITIPCSNGNAQQIDPKNDVMKVVSGPKDAIKVTETNDSYVIDYVRENDGGIDLSRLFLVMFYHGTVVELVGVDKGPVCFNFDLPGHTLNIPVKQVIIWKSCIDAVKRDGRRVCDGFEIVIVDSPNIVTAGTEITV